ALAAAKARGHRAVILLGDAPYYARFGFSAQKTGELLLPGPFERERLLALELAEGALDGAWGMIAAQGAPAPKARAARAKKALQPVLGAWGGAMSQALPAPRDGVRPRFRGTITTLLMVMLAVMIVRDIFVRRWSSAPLPSSDVTRRVP